MRCYIKDYSTFNTLAQRDTDSYDLTLDSMNGESSSLTLLGDDGPSTLNGNWILLNGNIWRIDKVSPANGRTKLTLLPPESIFDRTLCYTGTAYTTTGGYIASLILANWVNQTDTVYDTPYITVTNTDTTAIIPPETEDGGLFNFLAYIRKMRTEQNIVLGWAFSRNTLTITISKRTAVARPLVLNDGHTQLIKADYSHTALAKITAWHVVDTGTQDLDGNAIYDALETNWYLAQDGSVSSTPPQSRASGGWGTIVVNGEDDPETKATEEFGKNEESHKVELYSDVEMHIGDTARIKLNGEILESTVMGIYRKSGDIRTRYRLGDMITTLSERLERSKT